MRSEERRRGRHAALLLAPFDLAPQDDEVGHRAQVLSELAEELLARLELGAARRRQQLHLVSKLLDALAPLVEVLFTAGRTGPLQSAPRAAATAREAALEVARGEVRIENDVERRGQATQREHPAREGFRRLGAGAALLELERDLDRVAREIVFGRLGHRAQRLEKDVGIAEGVGRPERRLQTRRQAARCRFPERGREQRDDRAGAAQGLAVLVHPGDRIRGRPSHVSPRDRERAREGPEDGLPQRPPRGQSQLSAASAPRRRPRLRSRLGRVARDRFRRRTAGSLRRHGNGILRLGRRPRRNFMRASGRLHCGVMRSHRFPRRFS